MYLMAQLNSLIVTGPIRWLQDANGNILGNSATSYVAAKLGTENVGSSGVPIYLVGGSPNACSVDTTPTSRSNNLVTSGAVYTAIDNMPEPMVFRGTLGTGGTITALPTASTDNEGDTYKVITAGTYAGISAKIGDVFVSAKPEGASSYSWILIPAGDTDSDSWRNIKVNGTEKLSTSISSGAVDFVNGDATTVSFNATGSKISISHNDTSSQASVSNSGRTYIQSVTLDTYGHVTSLSSATETVVNTDEKVFQDLASSTGNYRCLLSYSTDATGDETNSVKKANSLLYDRGNHALTLGYRAANTTNGLYSVAFGSGNTSSGACSFACGNSSIASGTYSFACGSSTASNYYNFSGGEGSTSSGSNNSFAFGLSCTASGQGSVAFGIDSLATNVASFAEGNGCESSGASSHAEGFDTIASASYSHAEGYQSQATYTNAHAEGCVTTASGESSHSEGTSTEASAVGAHAEGSNTTASGHYSHAEGHSTVANHKSQHVFGECNILDTSTELSSARGNYVEIVGNGFGTTLSNARTLDWSGNEWLAGSLTSTSVSTPLVDAYTANIIDANVGDLIVTGASRFLYTINGSVSGTATNVTGTVAIANGGTGATTRLDALKNLTNESVGTSATHFLTITTSWGKGGYTNVADAKTVLGLGSAAYKNVPTSGNASTTEVVLGSDTRLTNARPASDTVSTYSSTGTSPINGTGVAAALGTLDGTITGSAGTSKTLSAFSQTDGKVTATFSDISITKSQVSDFPTSMTPTSHTHGNIQNGGTLQTNDVPIGSGDKLVITDSSDSSKIARSSLAFSASVSSQTQSTKFLREDGTWQAPSYTTNTNTTYTIGVGTGTDANNITLTSSSGSVQSITAPYATTAGSLVSTADAGGILDPVYFSDGVPVTSSGKSIPFIVGTGTTAGTWTGTLTGLTAYYDGLLILYKSPVAGGSSTTTLNLNGIGAKTVYLNSSSKLTTHYPANQPILLTYSASTNSGCFVAVDNYDSNSHRTVNVNGTRKLGNNTTALNFKDGTNTTVTYDSGVIINASDPTVTQTETTTSGDYEVLFSGTADSTTRSEGARKSEHLVYNPEYNYLGIMGAEDENNLVLIDGNGSISLYSTASHVLVAQGSETTDHRLRINPEDINLINGTWDGSNSSLVSAFSALHPLSLGDVTTPIHTNASGDLTKCSFSIYARTIAANSTYNITDCSRVFLVAMRKSIANTCVCAAVDQWGGVSYISQNDNLATVTVTYTSQVDNIAIKNKSTSTVINLFYMGWLKS